MSSNYKVIRKGNVLKKIISKLRLKIIINIVLLSMVPLFYVNCGAHNFQDGFDIQIPNGSLIFLKTDLNKDSVVDAADLKIFT